MDEESGVDETGGAGQINKLSDDEEARGAQSVWQVRDSYLRVLPWD
jgi:hypothetical protein